MSLFEVSNLSASLESLEIIKNINIKIDASGIYFMLGKNGAGKSTFAQALMADPRYKIEVDSLKLFDQEIKELKSEERAKLGLFVSFQNPPEIEGVSLINFLHTIYTERFGTEDELSHSTFKFRKHVLSLLTRVNLPADFIERSVNVGFSGGEKKRFEILQMILLKPKVAILDEIDSGLDIHAIQILEDCVKELTDQGNVVLYITHNVGFVKKHEASTIYIIKNGSITNQGTEDVLDKFIQG